jgi:hypothetical protein
VTELTPEQEAEVVSGGLSFTVDGKPHTVPELKWRANRDWQAAMQRKFAELVVLSSDTPEGMNAMADAQRELVLAYDVTGALGDLEDATERELDAIYDKLIEVSFPQAESRTQLMVTLVRLAAESAQANSTSGPSAIGTSEAPTPLKPRSRSDRSGSSTRRRRSA